MKDWTYQKVFTFCALLVLLFIRFPFGDFAFAVSRLFRWTYLSSQVDALRLFQNWMMYPWEKTSFLLVGIVVFINRGELEKINVDKQFLALLAVGGALFCWNYFLPIGWVGIIISGCIVYFMYKSELLFQYNMRPNSSLFILNIVAIFILYIVYRYKAFNLITLTTMIQYTSPRLPFLLAEEIVFRGLSWMYLEELGLSKSATIAIQAIIFWIYHIYYIFSQPFFFWVAVPLVGLLLGIVVWKYKSITPSAIAHLLFNLL